MEEKYNTREIREIEQELHIEILPGTEIMADIGSHHFVKSGDRSHKVLVPQPSEDKHDPLNWSFKWKIAAIIAAHSVTFTQGFGPLSLAPMFPDYIEAFHTTLPSAVQFTGVAILVLGFSNFLWVPISTSFGRRPVYIFSQLICFASCIWRAKANSYGSFMGACVLNGIGAGPAETIQPAVIADIFFLHDRGKWNTLYWVVYMGSLMVAPIISGPMSAHVGWRNFWYLNVGIIGLSLLLVVFCFPETKWDRATPRNGPSVAPQGVVEDEKGETMATEAQLQQVETAHRDPWLGKGYPSKMQWFIFQPNAHPFKSIALDLWVPWKLMIFPIVQFASFVVSWSCSSFLTLNLTQSQVFAAPPYNYSSQNIGFMNFAILVGAFIGLATAGPLSDWVSMRATIRNGGIREPEMRLPAMIPYVIIMYLGNIIVSVGYQNHWPWEAIVIIGFACAGIQVAALPSIVSTYAVDSYKPVAGSLFVSMTVNKNVWGYGFSKFITNWAEEAGFIPPIMTNASLILLWCLFGILFYFKGKTFRRWSKNSSVHRM
ncbi:serine/threonine kinase 16 [Rhizodiscina lignyota]|uniref:Serine/threonine kinase 16 n=1 Tax=Rhizodiscina lignyota TaxID=1504668 RepID=A0A9P4IUH1_9PEZI|nr:serine/threonine kinase 16 [Rhizodiscina lignyota]